MIKKNIHEIFKFMKCSKLQVTCFNFEIRQEAKIGSDKCYLLFFFFCRRENLLWKV